MRAYTILLIAPRGSTTSLNLTGSYRNITPLAMAAIVARGREVATRTGDLQTRKEIEVFLRRLEKRGG